MSGFDTSQRPAVMQAIARRAVLSFPWLRDLQIVRAWAALRVMPPDGLPIYDQSERFPGAFTANCHSGVTLAGGACQSLRADGRRGCARPLHSSFFRPSGLMFRPRPDGPQSDRRGHGRRPYGDGARRARRRPRQCLLPGLTASVRRRSAGASARPIA